MAAQFTFSLPASQDGTIQIQIQPPVSISGWTIRWDLMYRLGSQNPIISKYLASGFTSGQSGISLFNGANGIFNVSLFAAEISGVDQGTNVLAHQTWRINSGFQTPVVGGFRLLAPF